MPMNMVTTIGRRHSNMSFPLHGNCCLESKSLKICIKFCILDKGTSVYRQRLNHCVSATSVIVNEITTTVVK
ncbi:MAG: hypothetical protein AAFR60_10665, partial [Pseudomonadota bacterium]